MRQEGTQPSLLEPDFTPDPVQAAPQYDSVAQVVIDSPLPHLDQVFDYGIPEKLASRAHVGSRVSVPFGGKNLDGFIVAITAGSAQRGLKGIRRVIGAVPVVTDEILQLCRQTAERYAGSWADVLRLAVPPRHATTEKAVLDAPRGGTDAAPASEETREEQHDGPWNLYPAGGAFLRRIADGQSPRAVWSALPSPQTPEHEHWAQAIASVTRASLASGRGTLIIVPTNHDLATVVGALEEAGIDHATLTADLGPSARYESFLRVLLGEFRVVVGTRAAIYAPVPDLGMVICWDEMSDAYAEPRSPYAHARETLALRASLAGAGALFGGFARSPAAQHLVTSSWAQNLSAPRDTVRVHTPRVLVPDEYDLQREGAVGQARIPSLAWRRVHDALERAPVLFQVPRTGHTPGLACASCRRTARCTWCHGPLRLESSPPPECSWCTRRGDSWTCPHCEATTLRARSVGASRTAEELGRAFPGVPVRISGSAAARLEEVPRRPGLVVATPGAEPPTPGGYPLAILLDGAMLTDRPYLDAPVSALHRWMRAAALTRGEVMILGNPLTAPAQAAVRWDPAGFAQRELEEWSALGFPPQNTVASVTGERADVTAFGRYLPHVEELTVLGPAPVPGEVHTPGQGDLGIALRSNLLRVLYRVPASRHLELTAAVRAAMRIRSARREGRALRVKVNPIQEL